MVTNRETPLKVRERHLKYFYTKQRDTVIDYISRNECHLEITINSIEDKPNDI